MSGAETATAREVVIRQPASAAAVPEMRHGAEKQLAAWDVDPDTRATAGLVLTELVTNSLQHGGASEFVVRLAVEDRTVRIECDDPAVGTYPRRSARTGAEVEAGNGLNLVAELATQWGFWCGTRKTVYATVGPVSTVSVGDA